MPGRRDKIRIKIEGPLIREKRNEFKYEKNLEKTDMA
jgi:hypothetical protein